MRIALCLSGIVGGNKGKDGEGGVIDYKVCYDHYYKNIIKKNNVDVFIHSWSVEFEKDLIDLYSPKKSIFEPQKKFPTNKSLPFFGGKGTTPRDFFLINSRFYSSKEVISLKKSFEKENKFKYDIVMVSRFDLMWLVPLDFKWFNPNFFHISNWNNVHFKTKIADKINKSENLKRYLDLWFFSNSKYIDYFGDIYNKLSKVNVGDPHAFIWSHLNESGEIRKKIKFVFYRWFDYELYRNKVIGARR